jgi:hypothetical protein
VNLSLAISFQQNSRFHNLFAARAKPVSAFSCVHIRISFLFLFYLWAADGGFLSWIGVNFFRVGGWPECLGTEDAIPLAENGVD